MFHIHQNTPEDRNDS